MITDFGGFNMDITTYTMILVTKLWGLSWAYRDGALIKGLTKDQEERKVLFLPTLIEFYGFSLFCSGCIVGPFLEYNDYKNYIELEGNYKSLPRGFKNGFAGVKSGLYCLLKFVGVVVFHLFVVVGLGYNVYLCGTEEF